MRGRATRKDLKCVILTLSTAADVKDRLRESLVEPPVPLRFGRIEPVFSGEVEVRR